MRSSSIISKIKDLETLRRYGFDEEEIIELSNLRKEADGKVEEFKVI
jgi:hypothetical protein